MSSDAGGPPDPTAPPAEPEFTVPLPYQSDTQALPQPDTTRELPTDPTSPYAARPPGAAPATHAAQSPYAAPPPGGVPSAWTVPSGPAPSGPAQSPWPAPTAPGVPTAPTAPTGKYVDPLLEQIGVALFWITVGWWVFFLVRVMGYFVRFGGDAAIIIRTIDRGPEETLIAAVLSVLAALLLLFGRGNRGRSPLGYASAVLAVATVAVAVWRLVP